MNLLAHLLQFQLLIPLQLVMLLCYHLVMQVQVLSYLTLYLCGSVLRTTTHIRLEVRLTCNGVKVFIIPVKDSSINTTLDVANAIDLRLFRCYPRFPTDHTTHSMWCS